jgi:hypothetical protein
MEPDSTLDFVVDDLPGIGRSCRCACLSRGRPGDDAEASVSRTASSLPATKPHIATASTVCLHCDLRAEQH